MKFICCTLAFAVACLVVPYLIGAICCMLGKTKKQISLYFLIGNIAMWALFQLLAVPMIRMKASLTKLTILWCLLTLAFLLFGAIQKQFLLWVSEPIKNLVKQLWESSKKLRLLFVIMVIAVASQMFLYGALEHIDLDDARFVANAVAAWDNDTLLLTHPNTGAVLTEQIGELRKDAVSPWMLMIAMFAKISTIHPTVLAHTVLPPFLLLMVYCVIWILAEQLVFGSMTKNCCFVLLASAFHVIAGASVYHQVTFFMTRIWQGKAIVAGILLPMILYCMLQLEQKVERAVLFELFMINMAACCMSGMGLIMSAFMEGCFLLSLFCRKRKLGYLLGGGIICLPNIIYGILYMGSKMVQ